MVKSLLNRFKPAAANAEQVSEIDVSRVLGASSGRRRQITSEQSRTALDLQSWKQRDLDRLQACWQDCCDEPENETALNALLMAAHNLHGASGAYGGGALTRLTTSLQDLLSLDFDLARDGALINLHIQACRAYGLGEAADEIAGAVCDALERQVETRKGT